MAGIMTELDGVSEKRTIHFDSHEIPEVIVWKNGEHYRITLDVTQVRWSESIETGEKMVDAIFVIDAIKGESLA